MRESYTRTTLYLEIQHGLLDTKDAWESRTDDMNQIEIIRKIREKLSQKGHNSHAKKQPTQETQGSTMPPTTDNTEQDRFINHWRGYQGIGGFTRYTLRFLLIGLLLSPVVLTWLNPKIWQQLQGARASAALLPMAFLIGVFALLPSLVIAIALWRRKQKRFMQLTTEQNRYLPFEKRTWASGEKTWKIAISVMATLTAASALLSFWLLLGHNAPDYFAYPIEASVLFILIHLLYQLFMMWWAEKHDNQLSIPAIFKVALVVCFVAVVLALGNLFYNGL